MPLPTLSGLSAPAATTPEETSSALQWLSKAFAGLFVPLGGTLVGIVAGFVIVLVFKALATKSRIFKAWVKRTTLSLLTTMAAWGAWAALIVQDMWVRLTSQASLDIIDGATAEAQNMSGYQHLFLIIAIASTTWFIYTWLWVLEDAAILRAEADGAVSSRFATQAQVLRRLGQVIIWVVGIAFIIFTFPSARQFMGGLLASAGLVSVIAGLAAQSTLSNVFAGLQLAFTDAIRVGDTVVVGPKDQSGVIEEITLAYVVVRIWDQRRNVIPSSTFTTSIFENWSRRETQQQGTVELRLDWAAPMAQIRQKVASLLAASDLWDGRNWAVHVTDADKDTILVRIVVSAKNAADLFELRAMVRERLIDWIMTEEPWVRPAFLLRQQEMETVERDLSGEQLARLATELSGIAADTTGAGSTPASFAPALHVTTQAEAERTPVGGETTQGTQTAESGEPTSTRTDTMDHTHAARMKASRQKAKKARRRAMAERQRELAEGTRIAGEAEGNPDQLATKVITMVSSNSLTSQTARSAGMEGTPGE